MGQLPDAQPALPATRSYRFGPFLVDARSGELRRNGIRVRLQEQPFQVLLAMLETPGDLVLREDLHKRLWPTDTFVDFENSLNSAVNRLRDALGDAAENPQYVETLPRRGYRFIAPVELVLPAPPSESRPAASPAPTAAAVSPPPMETARPRGTAVWIAAAALVLVSVAALSWFRSAGPKMPAGKIMLAILPFDDLTGASDHQYFVEGLTDELILQLGKLRPQRLGVIARTSIMQYKGTRKSIEQIGRELGVQFVLTGTIRPARPASAANMPLLISAQLVQVQDQSSLWSESYEHTLRDFFEVQTDVAVRVTRSLAGELLPDLQSALARNAQIHPDAQAAYLKGRFFWNQRSQAQADSITKAVEYLEEATRLDPRFAAAHAALAAAQLTLATSGRRKIAEVLPLVRAANARALSIEPNLPEAYLNLARISMYDQDWTGAERLFQKTLALDANSADAHFYHSVLLGALKRYPEEMAELKVAMEIDPMSPSPLFAGSLLAERTGDIDTALAMSNRNAELLGRSMVGNFSNAIIYGWVNKCPEALEQLRLGHQQIDTAEGEDSYASDEAIIYHRCGDPAASKKAYAKAIRLPFMNGLHRGVLEAALGNTAVACANLEKAAADKEPSIPLLNIDPRVDPIRNQPCFQRILKRLGLPL